MLWKHEGEIIEVDERHKFMFEDEESMSLVIKSVNTEDAGEYTIEAVNELGQDTASINLTVKGKCVITKSFLLSLSLLLSREIESARLGSMVYALPNCLQ